MDDNFLDLSQGIVVQVNSLSLLHDESEFGLVEAHSEDLGFRNLAVERNPNLEALQVELNVDLRRLVFLAGLSVQQCRSGCLFCGSGRLGAALLDLALLPLGEGPFGIDDLLLELNRVLAPLEELDAVDLADLADVAHNQVLEAGSGPLGVVQQLLEEL